MSADDDLVRHLAASLAITHREAAWVVQEVVSYYSEPLQIVVKRRHAQCKARGMYNEQIFELIVRELEGRVVLAPPLSTRQVRRIIYG